MTRISEGFYRMSEWIMKFAYINILWIFFTLLGLFLFGLFPATAAMFAVNRKWVMGETGVPVFSTFWTTYKKDFLKSNILGLILVAIGNVLIYGYRYFLQFPSNFSQVLTVVFLLVFFFYVVILLYVFPIYVHFDMKIIQVFKNAILVMIMYPISTIMIVVGSFIVYFAMSTFPGLVPFFGGSLLSFVITWSAHYAFSKNEEKKQAGNKEN
ncbi:YesL family protein [Ammoniphilus sp. 3BR4]